MKKTTLVALAALLATGCGSVEAAPPSQGGTNPSVYADDSVLYRMGSGDFVTESTPARVAMREDYAIRGTVDGFADGRAESVTYSDGNTEVDRFVVIRIAVDEVLKGDPSDFESGYAFLTRPRGLESFDANGDPVQGGDAAIPVDEFGRFIPQGVRVLVMASASPRNTDNAVTTEEFRRGVSAPYAPILSVYNPQTLFLETAPENALTGWQGAQWATFDDVVDQVRRATSRPPQW